MSTSDATALFAWLDRELWLITAKAGDRAGGLIATTVDQASIVPDSPRVIISIARHHLTWNLIEMSDAFALHLLGDQNMSWVEHFGLQSGHQVDKLEGWPTDSAVTGSPILEGAVGWMDCRVEAKMDIGDRTIFLGEIVESQITNYRPPLTLKGLLEKAPPEIHSRIRLKLQQDSALDAEAIHAFRESQHQETLP